MESPEPTRTDDPVARLLARYSRMPGVPDEMIGPDGGLRPVWAKLVPALAAFSSEALAARQARGDRYLRDAGVFFRQYGPDAPVERDWPLSHMPVLIGEDEWAGIEAGLIQRAELLEQVVADIYGDNRLVAEGHLPPELVAGNPEWLRPLVGVAPRGGHYLHFLAFDIGRGPKGSWWVLGDRAQAPSGAGFALENRIATARAFPELYADLNVQRLAAFFKSFRDALYRLRGSEQARIAVLTPGLMNDTYFEHAYLARYLGLMLLEGEDLTVRNGEVLVRTVAGPRPVGVLWRRLDANWIDPLELEQDSRLGTPGMLGAIRAQSVTMLNALGSGVIEARAFLAFLPAISEALTGEPLALPNLATWWCGQALERGYVVQNAEQMTVGDAFATAPSFGHASIALAEGETLIERIERDGVHLVGQEAVTLSTTPALEDGQLVPRPMSLRIFLGRTPDGWQVMPGGLARIGRRGDTVELAMQKGGSTADLWVVGHRPAARVTMLATSGNDATRQKPEELPSRAADNLFWLGRYVERAENAIRLTRAYHLRLAEASAAEAELLDAVSAHLTRLGASPELGLPQGLGAMITSAANTAARVRDRFSVDGWSALSDLDRTLMGMSDTALPGDDMARAMSVLLRKTSGFSGLVHDNMYRFTGWRFLSIGRALERACLLADLLVDFGDADAPDGSLDLALEAADSTQSHRKRYAVSTSRQTLVDLIALDTLNPRAIIHQLDEIETHVGFLPDTGAARQLTPLQRSLLQLRAMLAGRTPEALTTPVLAEIRTRFAALSDEFAEAYFG